MSEDQQDPQEEQSSELDDSTPQQPDDSTPEGDSAPAEDSTPSESDDSTPAGDSAPEGDSASADDSTPAESDDSTPTGDSASSEATHFTPLSPITSGESQEIHRVKFEQLNLLRDLEVDRNVDRYDDVSLRISIELGRVTTAVKDILDWREGSLVETNKIQGEAMEIMVNGKCLGKGEVVVVGDNLAIRITELHKPDLI